MIQLLSVSRRRWTVSMMLMSIAWAVGRAQGPLPSIEGLWGAETRVGMPVAGELTIDGRDRTWIASIAGYRVPIRADGQIITFALPNHMGSFQGRAPLGKKELRGEWIQPGGVVLDPQYASSVVLHSTAAAVWRGNIVPLEQRLSAYLLVSSKDGKMTAIASNPEGNFFRRRTYTVTESGTNVILEANGQRFSGSYDAKAGTLSIQLADWLPPFTFNRRNAEDAIGFYPRVPSKAGPWVYRKPTQSTDGWTVSTPKHEDVKERELGQLIDRILQADPTGSALRIQSLLIARHGKLILEEYFYGFSQDRVHDMRSAGKTFAPVLIGVARQGGAKIGPQTLVSSLFTKEAPFANPDDRKQSMTLRDIMSMTAGNACDDGDENSPGNEDRMQSDPKQSNWYKYTLDLPMKKQPGGEQAIYCSGDLNLVGGAAAVATQTWLPNLFEEKLARPLQFGPYYLNLMPNGEAYMGGGAYILPRDQLKLGQVYLGDGLWNGRRVVSSEWVADSTRFHARFAKDRSLGQEHGYGFGWHLHSLESGGKSYKVFAAEGNGGQFVIVIPALDLVVGMTGGSYGEFDQWYRWELELVPRYIIPAVQKR